MAITREALLAMRPAALREVLDAGHTIVPTALDDAWYRGTSLGLWGWVEAMSWKTFAKTFHRDPADGSLRGWNVRLHQDGLDAPPRPIERDGAPVVFGHYTVTAATPGLLLDYGCNPWWDPSSRVRDPVVALEPGDATRLLGWTYLAMGPLRVPTPSFFLLERAGELPFVARRR